MKRYLLTAFVLFALLLTGANGETLVHVSDLADVLTPAEEALLQQQAQELYDLTGFDVILHTTNDSQGKGAENYSYDYHHAFRDPSVTPDSSLFAVMFDIRESYETARGTGIELLTHRESNELRSLVRDKLTRGDYYIAMRDYVRYVRRILIPPTPVERVLSIAPFILIGGLIVGLVYALILLSKLKIARFKTGAEGYVIKDSLNLTQSEDIFLYQTVTRTKIQSSSGGNRSGGGFSSGSRGGTSYGGRSGGRF